MTIRDLMNTDCLDLDEILLNQKTNKKKNKVIQPLSNLAKGGKT